MPEDVRRVPQQDRARKSVDAILDATADLLSGGVPSDVTMSAIGERAGISKAAIYRYYPDRGAVMRALANRYLEQLDAFLDTELAGISSTADAVTRFGSIVDRFYQLMVDEPGLRTIWITGFNSAELGTLTLETADRLAKRFVDASAHVLADSGERTERRFAMAIHMCRAAIEMALHRGDSGQVLIDEFKRVVFLASNVPPETADAIAAALALEDRTGDD